MTHMDNTTGDPSAEALEFADQYEEFFTSSKFGVVWSEFRKPFALSIDRLHHHKIRMTRSEEEIRAYIEAYKDDSSTRWKHSMDFRMLVSTLALLDEVNAKIARLREPNESLAKIVQDAIFCESHTPISRASVRAALKAAAEELEKSV